VFVSAAGGKSTTNDRLTTGKGKPLKMALLIIRPTVLSDVTLAYGFGGFSADTFKVNEDIGSSYRTVPYDLPDCTARRPRIQ
jgi:hypothetical protein